jgi:N-acetylmuramoyl-L-alanine amidase
MKAAMKRATRFLLLAILALGGMPLFAATPSRKPETADILGKRYVRVTDWAGRNGLEVRWLRHDEKLELSNRQFKVHLTLNSNDSDVNGVNVRLLFAVASKNGVPYVAQLDADTTLQPLLSPPKNGRGSAVKTICLDPGHGGKDPGFRVGGKEEKKYTLLLAQELRDQLTRAGFKVSLTRTADKWLDLPNRPEVAKRRNADVLISLHFNAFTQKTVQGTEVYCLTPAGAPSTNARGEGAGAGWLPGNRYNDKNMFLAYQMQKALTKNLAVEDRGVHRARFAVLKDAVMPAVLIEGGFLSHPVEGRKIADPGYRRQMARAIAEGLTAYQRQVEQR